MIIITIRINFRQAMTGEVLDSVEVRATPGRMSQALRDVLTDKLAGEWLIDAGDSITLDDITEEAK